MMNDKEPDDIDILMEELSKETLSLTNKLDFAEVYSDLVEEWIVNGFEKPLLIHYYYNLFDDQSVVDYLINLNDDIYLYSLLLGESTLTPVRILIIFSNEFYKVDLFGNTMSTEEYEESVAQFNLIDKDNK